MGLGGGGVRVDENEELKFFFLGWGRGERLGWGLGGGVGLGGSGWM